MTDTSAPVAPPSAPSAPSAPFQPNPPPQAQNNLSEVSLNTNQTSSPNPIGNQAPDKPPPSRREAIQAAFDRATRQHDASKEPNRTQLKPPPKPAEAKAGHNQPPEPLKRKDKPQKASRRAAPRQGPVRAPGKRAEQCRANQGKRKCPRCPKGRECPGYEWNPGKKFRSYPSREHSVPGTAAAHGRPRQGGVGRRRRSRCAARSTACTRSSATPTTSCKPVAEAFQPIARFHQMAQQHGTTLERALTNYTSMEQKLRSDVVGGLDVIVNNLGLKAPDGPEHRPARHLPTTC